MLDRAAGVLLGMACGDALGVPYEFARPPGLDEIPVMKGGGLGPYAPGEYSDDTQMAVCIARVAASGADLRGDDVLDEIAEAFLDWAAHGASDIGAQTAAVLSAARRDTTRRPAAALRRAARDLHDRTGRTAGNGSLMRTGVVALPYLDDPAAMADAARAVSDLTHADALAGDACVLWCAAVRRAVLDAVFDIAEGLDLVPAARRDSWARHLADAAGNPASSFRPNGFTVTALQAAWSAVISTRVPADDPGNGIFACRHLTDSLAVAVRTGGDTDTVAAITGALAGARWGSSAVPLEWASVVHGWPGLRAPDLVRLAVLAAARGADDEHGWPSAPHRAWYPGRVTGLVPHPEGDGVLLGSLGTEPDGADAVVSLCKASSALFPGIDPGRHLQVWLMDETGGNNSPHYVIDQAARAVAALRAGGHRVFVHCYAVQSRTAAVAARYATLASGISPDEAFAGVAAAIGRPVSIVNPELRAAVYQLAGEPTPPPAARGKYW